MGYVEAEGSKTPGGSCHLVAMPLPARGHINPMMNLCKLIASKARDDDDDDEEKEGDILITFVVTEEWLGFLSSDPKPANIRFRSIPNVIPSENGRVGNLNGFFEAVMTQMEGPFEQLLDQLEIAPTAIITDNYMKWTVALANRRNIPVASLCTFSPSAFLAVYHFQLLVQNGHFPPDSSGMP
ncbi:hypothetical protein NE237_005054 [Protea cynaroides]|uniref:Uncharacterized protein n=1 Tax=Protea cynaroides TaxID=273540 RepID=A0A9Q0QU61_9MAGN|nr:hypothetical protein NE237_005054 [Protea cynaroides]